MGTTVVGQSLTIVSGIAAVLINLVLILILSFYMTLDGPRLAARLLEMLPAAWRADTVTFFAIVNRTFGAFLRAQLVQALFYGLATAVLMVTLGLSDIALASVLAAVMVLIPLIGGIFAIIPPLVIVLIENPDRFLLMLDRPDRPTADLVQYDHAPPDGQDCRAAPVAGLRGHLGGRGAGRRLGHPVWRAGRRRDRLGPTVPLPTCDRQARGGGCRNAYPELRRMLGTIDRAHTCCGL